MQAIILAAGNSTRTEPLTNNIPKGFLKVANKTLLEHNLDQIIDIVDEVIIVVGYKKEIIMDYFGNQYKNLKVKYVKQKESIGTANALNICKDYIEDEFILMMSDDLYHKKDIQECLKHKYSALVKKVDNPQRFGVYVIDDDNNVKDLIEKPKKFISNLANCGLYKLNKNIFNIKIEKSTRGEYEITDAIKKLSRNHKIKTIEVQNYWFSVGYAWDLININKHILKNINETMIKGVIEKNATIKGNIYLGENSIIKNGSYIEGPIIIGNNCTIGPNCYIRSATTIGNNSKIGNAVEIKNSIIMDNTNVGHLSYIGDSIISNNCNIGAGTITANLRHDNKSIKSKIKKELIDTIRKKFGTIMGEKVHTGIHTSIYPGRKFWPNTTTKPGEIVIEDKLN